MQITSFVDLSRFAVLSTLLLGTIFSCDQGTNNAGDAPEIRYTILVQDSLSQKPLDSVSIEARTEFDTVSAVTKSPDGRADLAPVFGRRTVFLFARTGYVPSQLTDTVSAKDSSFAVVERILRIRMVKVGGLAGAQVVIMFRDIAGDPITGGQATYEDSLGIRRTNTDSIGLGHVGVAGLASGKNPVLVQRSGYLGRRIDVEPARGSSTDAVPRVVAVLPKLAYGVSGSVFEQGLGAAYAFTGGAAEFRCKDSGSVPLTFRALIKDGRFELDKLPAVAGDIRIFRTAGGVEPIFTRSLAALEVEADGPLAPIVVKAKEDSAGMPLITSVPRDSILPEDTLLFTFNQRVALTERLRISLPNISPELFVTAEWDSAGKTLKVRQRLDTWLPGKRYEYSLRFRNAQGGYFNRPGDTLGVITGGFTIKTPGAHDTGLALPATARWAFFNSGENPRFDSLDVNSSPLADSSSRFARLRWSFGANKARKVDSLVLFLRDGSTQAPSFTRFDAYPAAIESVTVDFGAWYAVRSGASSQPPWPLRLTAPGAIEAQLVPKSGNVLLDTARLTLSAVQQGMGPSLWVKYDIGPGLTVTSGATDTIEVTYLISAAAGAEAFDFKSAAAAPKPRTTLNGAVDSTQLAFKWIDGKKGSLIYRFNQFPPLNGHLKAELDGIPWLGRPIWVRNRNADVTLP